MIIKFLIFNLLLYLFRCNTKVNFTYPQNDFLRIDSENIEEAFENNDYWLINLMNIKTNELHVMSAYNHSTYDLDTLDRELLKLFVNKNRFPLVMKIDHRNFFNIRSSGNNLMLLLLDMKKNPNAYILEYKQYAEKYKNHNDILFGYIDGKYYEENLELYGTDSDYYPQIIVFSKNPREYYFEGYFNIDNVDNIICNILIKFKKHIKYILKKAFKTDFLSFIGFICSVIMMLLTAILVIHTIYKYYMSYTHNTYIEKEEKSE
ncbi:hypothetical protein PFAG_03379 [Plasmodium falciparum Santa Lucia]|uniref:Thioredoxin-like fold domain-containing protein n=1 Tax=Plasmodium falciparum Santa Lucia TaxID=478859 RepID=W7G306_PLAFA|nr:hypothetical protein PFAG_03379 [Plasmodium falciparum Santa Lucia]